MTAQIQYSVLHTWRLRPLPIALAHRFYTARFGDPQMDVLKRHFFSLSAKDRNVCRAEFVRKLAAAA